MSFTITRKTVIAGAIVILVAVVTVMVLMIFSKQDANNPFQAFSPPLVDRPTLHSLPQKKGSSADVSRIDGAIIPPTNAWISGMVLQQTPLAVYPMPLSFLAKDNGFEIGLPRVQSAPTVITGPHTPGITAEVKDATRFSLTRYDKVSASIEYEVDSNKLGRATLSEGSPYVFYRALQDASLEVTALGQTANSDTSASYLRYTKDAHDYVITAHEGARIRLSGSTAFIEAPKDSLVTFYSLPTSGDDPLRDFSGNELNRVAVSHSETADKMSETTLIYETANKQPTVFVPMTYHSLVSNNASLLTYESIYGPMKAVSGTSFTLSSPLAMSSNQLDISKLSDAHKKELISLLPADVAKTAITATDSYFAGKQLARAATLLDIAEQLDQKSQSDALKAILKDAFSSRLNGKYFYYDSTLKGIAAENKAFGSEDFNDHHFHYGYFIYAASILGKYDDEFLKSSQKMVNLLVADIASYESSSDFPVQRNYDPYAGHSWAAGLSPFADGNNQESSSEAMHAWNGVALWAELTGNKQLATSAKWMLSNEAATAKAAWRTVDTSASYLKNYSSPLTSLSFGGKRTYSTFFSDEPNTKLGIQLIPMNPQMLQFVNDGTAIDRVVAASIRNDNYNVALGDYVLMYKALSDPQKASTLLPRQQDFFIDDGNSRTYVHAWVYSLTDS